MKSLLNQFQWAFHEDGLKGTWRVARRLGMRLLFWSDYQKEQKRKTAEAAKYQTWLMNQLPDENERTLQAAASFSHKLTFVIPTWNTNPKLLKELAASLLAQTCPNWIACFYDGASDNTQTLSALRELPDQDQRFHVIFGTENLGISGNTNAAIEHVTTDYIALCDHDDLLSPDAVYHLLSAAEDGADLIYSDEDKVDESGTLFFDPHLKGDYAPDTLRSGNYICHLLAAETALIRRVNGFRSVCDGSQDHDIALRMALYAKKITHIPRILYHWRMLSGSASHSGTERCVNAALTAVQYQLEVLGLKGEVFRDNMQPRIRYRLDRQAKVSLLFTGTQKEMKRLVQHTTTPFHETLLADSAHLTSAAQRATGDYLMFAAPGVIPQQKKWLQEMLMFAQRKDVACVGAPLLDSHGRYLHAGYAVDVPGGAISYHYGCSIWGRPYQLTDRIVRNVTGVSCSWMLIRKEIFLQLGSTDNYVSDLRGAVLGLRALHAGFVNVITPYAKATVHRPAPCLISAAPDADLLLMQAEENICEKYYSSLFEKEVGTMSLDFASLEVDAAACESP